MRLLQLATAPDRLIDLHPNVTVVSGLDDGERRVLVDTVVGLARGAAPDRTGLLEAHGLLFDLTDDMLSLLDVSADDLRPLVTAVDLPTIKPDSNARDRIRAERALSAIEERVATAEDHQHRLQLAHQAATDALECARRNATEADAGAAERIRLIEELTAQLDQLDARRGRLQEEQAVRVPEAEAAIARRAEVDAATIDVRARHQDAAILCSALAAQLDQTRRGLDPESVAEAEAAAEALARVKAEVKAEAKAERAAEEAAGAVEPEDEEEPLADRLARAQAGVEELEKRLAAFGPMKIHEVSNALDHLRARDDGELVPSPEAEALADRIAALEDDLAAHSGVRAITEAVASGRTRLADARQALQEAEQAARKPELDREVVERLEVAHEELLDALEKSDGRFAGARTQRRVETARRAEHALLDQLGFVSYPDYMLGYSLLDVDPEKEAALDVARAELSAAEDEWQLLQADAAAELARAERTQRRRLLLGEARTLLGRVVDDGAAVAELRAVRVRATLPPELVEGLQQSLDRAGIAVAGELLARDELVHLAEAWLEEARDAAAREQELRGELAVLGDERAAALAAMEAADRPSPEEDRVERVNAARAAVAAADERQRTHLAAEALLGTVAAELAAASEAERVAAEEASDAETAVAEATDQAELLNAEVVRIAEELETLDHTQGEVNGRIQSLSDQESASPEQLALKVSEAETAFAAADARLAEASASLQDLVVERSEAQALVASLHGLAEPIDAGSLAEEIEWYLLARLAAQRAACLGGSLPLLLDDALGGLDEEQLGHVLGRLERMADAVQVIVVSDDPLAASWALMAGQDRAAVVRPQPA